MSEATAGTRPTTRDLGITTDAFFVEERANTNITAIEEITNPLTGTFRNKFDFPTKADAWKTVRTEVVNPLADPNIALRRESGNNEPFGYSIFRPPGLEIFGTKTTPVPVTLFFGPGAELNRHGLRSAFAKSGAVLVTLPGREQMPRYGFGITQAQLVDLFAQAEVIGTPQIRVLAGFSTGYRGVNGVINNTKSMKSPPAPHTATGANPGTGLDLRAVTKVIYFDAFYQGDDPAPGHNTATALTAIQSETDNKAELVIYDVTQGGTPNPLRAPIPKNMPTRHLKLKSSIVKYNALILARVIDVAIQDGFTTEAEVVKFGGQAIIDLIKEGLPARGTVGSEPGSGTVNVTNWTTDKKAAAASASGPKMVDKLIRPHQLMAWETPNFGEFQHDAHIFEFGWEHMVPS